MMIYAGMIGVIVSVSPDGKVVDINAKVLNDEKVWVAIHDTLGWWSQYVQGASEQSGDSACVQVQRKRVFVV